MLNGGASLALAEIVAGHGSMSLCREGEYACGVQVSGNHLSAVPVGGKVFATGKLIHRGRSSHIWNIDITTPQGELVSTVRVVNFILKRNESTRYTYAKLLDCLTHSHLGFALYRLPWTDECYLVLQTSGDVEQLADIQELNGKKGFVMAPFRISEEHPLVLIRPDVTAYDWNEISEALSSLECVDTLLTCKSRQNELSPLFPKKRIKNNIPAHSGVSSLPYKRSSFKNWFCHVLPPDISEMIFTTWRFCPGL